MDDESFSTTELPSLGDLSPRLLLDLAAGSGSAAAIAERHGLTAVQVARLRDLPSVKVAIEAKRAELMRKGYGVEIAAEETLLAVINAINSRVKAGSMTAETLLDAMVKLAPITGRSLKGNSDASGTGAPAATQINITFDARGVEDLRKRPGVTVDLPGVVQEVGGEAGGQ